MIRRFFATGQQWLVAAFLVLGYAIYQLPWGAVQP